MKDDAASIAAGQGNPPSGGSVVLMRGRSESCATLLQALSARGLSPVVVDDVPAVMVALAELMRRGLQRQVLIVVEPDLWTHLDELLSAVRSFHGSVHCWRFDAADQARPMLSALRTTHGDQADSEASPVGKIHKRPRSIDRLLVSAPGDPASTREVVTQQELTMLLGPAPGEAG
ncbi:MAG: hypothetical protein AAGI37_13340 [Planctomycetota bacterium]